MSAIDLPPPPSVPEPAAEATAGVAFDDLARGQMERMLSDLGRVYRERNAAWKDLEQAHLETLLRLAVAAELRDDDTGIHIVRLGFLAEALGRHLGMRASDARALRLAAPMHDIGKIGVADRVLKKPGPLTESERAEMQSHPRMGAEILGRSGVALFQLAAEVAMTHHERWDGGGYPNGLAGDAIPLTGRIVAVVDYFDALTMDRCYRKAMPDARVLGMLRSEAGRAFDPAVVDCFLAHASELIFLRESINRQRLSFDRINNWTPPEWPGQPSAAGWTAPEEVA